MSAKGIDATVCIRDSETALKFYRYTIGLEHVTDLELPQGLMHRLRWGTSLIKLIRTHQPATAANPPGGLAVTGIRALTLTVADIGAIMARCQDGVYTTFSPVKEFRPGLFYAVVEDPESNLVELLQDNTAPEEPALTNARLATRRAPGVEPIQNHELG